jgi:hypothetical protein
VNWHGLVQVPHGYGFIQTLGIQDFNCTGDLCQVAHSAADTGAEFSASWSTDLTFFEPLQWYAVILILIALSCCTCLDENVIDRVGKVCTNS